MAERRKPAALGAELSDARAVFHLAAQVAVTTCLVDPQHDFAVNEQGTMNLLECVRRQGNDIPVIFASTNKVYGDLADLELAELDDRYVPRAEEILRHGVGETRGLDCCTPYGSSKGVRSVERRVGQEWIGKCSSRG